tara:strand:- start:2876 stop:3340 length:465 start_codon:yes stop_codon:yes gene_type:complete
MGLYEELLEKEKRRKEFLDRTFNATQSDVVRNLLTSDNIHEGKDTRNLETYLTESGYDVSAIIAGTQEVKQEWNRPRKLIHERSESKEKTEQLKTEQEHNVRMIVDHRNIQTLTDEKIPIHDPVNIQTTITPTIPFIMIAGLLIAGFIIYRRLK